MRNKNDRNENLSTIKKKTITVPHVETNLAKTLRISSWERANFKQLSKLISKNISSWLLLDSGLYPSDVSLLYCWVCVCVYNHVSWLTVYFRYSWHFCYIYYILYSSIFCPHWTNSAWPYIIWPEIGTDAFSLVVYRDATVSLGYCNFDSLTNRIALYLSTWLSSSHSEWVLFILFNTIFIFYCSFYFIVAL